MTPTKQVLLEELENQRHAERVEDVIFWALEYYANLKKPITNSVMVASYLKQRILLEEENKKHNLLTQLREVYPDAPTVKQLKEYAQEYDQVFCLKNEKWIDLDASKINVEKLCVTGNALNNEFKLIQVAYNPKFDLHLWNTEKGLTKFRNNE